MNTAQRYIITIKNRSTNRLYGCKRTSPWGVYMYGETPLSPWGLYKWLIFQRLHDKDNHIEKLTREPPHYKVATLRLNLHSTTIEKSPHMFHYWKFYYTSFQICVRRPKGQIHVWENSCPLQRDSRIDYHMSPQRTNARHKGVFARWKAPSYYGQVSFPFLLGS
jgi:nitrite reductase/ring-hydroxylating ferredoxin subunit